MFRFFLASVAIAAAGNSAAGEFYADLNLRYEGVEQDNTLDDATALTLRTRAGYRTGVRQGFSGVIEIEDSRILFGVDEFSVGPTGFNPGQYSVIADPETTELDQAFLQYAQDDSLTIRLGRQVIALDGQRFVGHVGWRQDRQTFDAVTVRYAPVKELAFRYSHIIQRNRIFADDADIDSSDHLLNASYKSSIGTLTGYAYLLEDGDAADDGVDTFGLSLAGARSAGGIEWSYAVDVATQDSTSAGNSFDANYWLAEIGAGLPAATIKLGYEVLGSDGGNYGFSTPLATLHKFNGWADQFLTTPAQGLEDLYLLVNGTVFGVNWQLARHDFSAARGGSDFGNEVDLQLTRKFAKNYTAGLKLAAYDAGGVASGKVDTDKLWVWVSASF